jgi:Tol biopolymer transport system component
MTLHDRTDLRIADLLEEIAPPRLPSYAGAISDRARRMSQRPRWSFASRWAPWWPARPPVNADRVVLALLVVVLLIALAVAGIVGSPPRLPPPFGLAGNGLLVYDDGTGVRLRSEDGARLETLGATGTADSRPAVSLDGRRVAFLRESEGGRAIVVADLTGGAAREVVRTADAGGPASLFPEPPAWSPDGRHIAVAVLAGVAGPNEHAEIWIIDVDTLARSVLRPGDLTGAESPVWAPDGERIAFLGSPTPDPVGFLYVIRTDGTGLDRVSDRESSARAGYLGPFRWSPKGASIAVEHGDAARLDRVVLLIDVLTHHEEILSSASLDALRPSWSPDGGSVAYWREVRRGGRTWQVVVVDLATRRETVLAFMGSSAGSITWAPDGTALTVAECRAGTCQVLLLDLAHPARAPTPLFQVPAKSLTRSIESAYWSWQRVAR